MAYGHICISSGAFMIYLLNTMMPWRKVCLVCANVPLVTAIATYFVSENQLSFIRINFVTDQFTFLQHQNIFIFHSIQQKKTTYSYNRSPIPAIRFLKHLSICSRRTELPKQKNLCVGFEDGCHMRMLLKSLTIYIDKVNDQSHVTLASNMT